MFRYKLSLLIFITLFGLALSIPHQALALTLKDQTITQFFQLMTGWNRSSLEIYREGDPFPEEKGETVNTLSAVDSCIAGDDCECTAIVEHCNETRCYTIEQSGRATSHIPKRYTADKREILWCNYEINVRQDLDSPGTQFSNNNKSSEIKEEELVIPKLQSGVLAYENNPGPGLDPSHYGFLNLTLPIEDQINYKTITAKKARATKNLCARTKNCQIALGFVDPDHKVTTTKNGQNYEILLGELFDELPVKVQDREPGFTRAVLDAIDDGEEWAILLMASPMLPPAEVAGYTMGNLTINWPFVGEVAVSLLGDSGKKEGNYPDAVSRPVHFASLIELNTFAPPETVLQTLEKTRRKVSSFLFACLEDATEACTYEYIIQNYTTKYQTLTPPEANEILNSRKKVQALRVQDGDGFSLTSANNLEQDKSGAIEPSLISQLIDAAINAVYIPISRFENFFQRYHYIPPLHAQAISEIQKGYQDTFFNMESQATHNTEGATNSFLTEKGDKPAGLSTVPQRARQSLAILSCDDVYNYSSPANVDGRRTDIRSFSLYGQSVSCVESLDDSSGAICEVAEAYNIDCDFFKAVYAIETCSGTNLPKQNYGSLNCCNSIGFCGPMAVGGGIIGTISPDKNRDVCMEEKDGMDSFELAARWMLIKRWCTNNASECIGSSNPYEWKESYIKDWGEENIKTREKIEDFVYGWYGSIYPDTDTQKRWGTGVSYVDAVEEYLNTGSIWGQCAYQPPK